MSLLHRSAVVLGIAVAIAGLPAGVAVAQDLNQASCAELWRLRNQPLKRAGYCFTDARTIRAFGNDGCTERNEATLKLTPQERDLIARVLFAERMKLCR